MAKSENQKKKLIFLMKILTERTSKDNGITMPEILDALEECGITAERKSIYNDITAINEFGEYIKVERYKKDGNVYYYAVGQILSLADIKMLADLIAASKFVTEKRSRELIGKLERLVSAKEKRQLNRTVYIRRHAFSGDDDGYSNVDPIQTALRENRQISFTYLQWDETLTLVPRSDGKKTQISPWWLVYNNENYYLGAYDGTQGKMKTYRVDKMRNVRVLTAVREGAEAAKASEPAQYAQARFEMFDGRRERVRVRCPRTMIGTFVDKIGREAITVYGRSEEVELTFEIVPNRFFLGWLLAIGSRVRLLSPQHSVDEFETMAMQMILNHERREITTLLTATGKLPSESANLAGLGVRVLPVPNAEGSQTTESAIEDVLRENGLTPSECMIMTEGEENIRIAEGMGIRGIDVRDPESAYMEAKAFLAAHRIENREM